MSFRLESFIHAPKSLVFKGFYPQSLGAYRLYPQKALPCAERRVFSHYWSTGPDLTHCGLGKESKKGRKKKDSGKLAIRPDHPRRRIEVKVCMPGGLQCVVLSSFIEIGPVVSPLWEIGRAHV